MICPNCQKECPESAAFCGNCGNSLLPNETQMNSSEPNVQPEVAPEQPAETFLNASEPTVQETPAPAEPTVQPENTAAPAQFENGTATGTPAAQPEAVTPPQVATPVQPENTDGGIVLPKKKRSKVLPLSITLGAVAVVAILVIVFFPFVKNLFRNIFLSNKDYMAAVINEDVSTFSDSFSKSFENSTDLEKNNGKGTASLEISDTVKEMIKEYTGEDIPVIEGLKVDFESAIKGDSAYIKVKGDINNDADFDASLVAKNGKFYARTGSTGSKYFELPQEFMSSSGSDELSSTMPSVENLTAITDTLPDGKTLKKLITKYGKLTTKHLNNVEKTKKTIDFGGIKTNTVELTADIDSAFAYDVITDILKTAKSDEDIKNIIKKIGDSEISETNGKKAVENYEKSLEEALEILKKDDFKALDQYKIRFSINVDSYGNVLCRTISFNGFDVSFYTLAKGKDIACGIVVKQGNQEIKAIVKGKKNGDKISGDVSVSYLGVSMKIAEFEDIDLHDIENGNMSGKIIFTGADLPVQYLSLISEEIGDDICDFIKGSKIIYDFKTSNDESQILVEWTVNGESLIKYIIKYNKKDMSIPSVKGAKSAEDLSEADMQNLQEKIEEIGEAIGIYDYIGIVQGYNDGDDEFEYIGSYDEDDSDADDFPIDDFDIDDFDIDDFDFDDDYYDSDDGEFTLF